MSSKFSIIVSMPDKDPEKFELEGDTTTIGRGPDNDIQVLISEVSVKHGEFVIEGETCKIKDNGSTNGTKVNGAKVGPEGTVLSPMDKLLLGETIPAYFVPTAVLESTPIGELIDSIEASPKSAKPKTAAVAVASPGSPAAPGAAKPAPVSPAAPAAAKPAPVQPGGPPRPAAPAPAKPAAPMPAKPAAPVPVQVPDSGASTVRLDQVRPPAPKPPGAPPAPGGVKPPQPVPLKRPPAPAPKKPGE